MKTTNFSHFIVLKYCSLLLKQFKHQDRKLNDCISPLMCYRAFKVKFQLGKFWWGDRYLNLNQDRILYKTLKQSYKTKLFLLNPLMTCRDIYSLTKEWSKAQYLKMAIDLKTWTLTTLRNSKFQMTPINFILKSIYKKRNRFLRNKIYCRTIVRKQIYKSI